MVKPVDNYLNVQQNIIPMANVITSRTSIPLFLTLICKQTSSVANTSLLLILEYTTKYTISPISALKPVGCIQLFTKSDTLGTTVKGRNYADSLFTMFSTKIPRFLSNIIFTRETTACHARN